MAWVGGVGGGAGVAGVAAPFAPAPAAGGEGGGSEGELPQGEQKHQEELPSEQRPPDHEEGARLPGLVVHLEQVGARDGAHGGDNHRAESDGQPVEPRRGRLVAMVALWVLAASRTGRADEQAVEGEAEEELGAEEADHRREEAEHQQPANRRGGAERAG